MNGAIFMFESVADCNWELLDEVEQDRVKYQCRGSCQSESRWLIRTDIVIPMFTRLCISSSLMLLYTLHLPLPRVAFMKYHFNEIVNQY